MAWNLSAAGTTQATATQLTDRVNSITASSAGNGVRLVPSNPGLVLFIVNGSRASIIVYPFGADTINGAACLSLGAGQFSSFSCPLIAGNWLTR